MQLYKHVNDFSTVSRKAEMNDRKREQILGRHRYDMLDPVFGKIQAWRPGTIICLVCVAAVEYPKYSVMYRPQGIPMDTVMDGGDGGSQSNDAEIHAVFPRAILYNNKVCRPDVQVLDVFDDLLGPPATRVTVWISNKHVRVQNDAGFDRRICSECLWALNGQADEEGSVNEDTYLSFNRVNNATHRREGVGICTVRLTWNCHFCVWPSVSIG